MFDFLRNFYKLWNSVNQTMLLNSNILKIKITFAKYSVIIGINIISNDIPPASCD